jgi:hypothetical protein
VTSSLFAGESGSRKVEHATHRHPGLVAVSRLGWVTKGVVYLVLGALAVPIAFQGSGSDTAQQNGTEASQLGAVTEIADSSFGELALYVIAIGLALYVVWRLVSVVLPAENSASAWLTRAGYLVSAAVYGALAWTALSFARHTRATAGSESEDAKVERFTRDLMEKTGGRWLVGAIGVVVIGIGVVFAVKGLKATFRDELELRGVGPVRHEWIVTLGRIGWVGRGIVMALVGWLLLRAAVRFRPDEAKGFDGALREVTGSTAGAALVAAAAVGLVLYGLFCIISAPRQRLTGAD